MILPSSPEKRFPSHAARVKPGQQHQRDGQKFCRTHKPAWAANYPKYARLKRSRIGNFAYARMGLLWIGAHVVGLSNCFSVAASLS